MSERVSVPCCLHDGSDSYNHTADASVASTFSGMSVVSTGSHVSDVSRSHTPPERDINPNKSSCMSTIGVAENVSSQGVSFTDTCCANNSVSMNSTYMFVI